jgi:CBS domain-containing protein
MGTKVSSVLKHKGHDVFTVAPQESVASVVKLLTQNRIGAVPVINQEGQLVGIISERDIIRGMSEHAGRGADDSGRPIDEP